MSARSPESAQEAEKARQASLPPRWFIRAAWVVHRALYRITGGRFGLRPATDTTWGMMRLKTVGRKSGQQRVAILGFYEDGPNIVTMAMNGWGEAEPAWWLNLQASADVVVELPDGPRKVRVVPLPRMSDRDCGSCGGSTAARTSIAGRPADRARRPW